MGGAGGSGGSFGGTGGGGGGDSGSGGANSSGSDSGGLWAAYLCLLGSKPVITKAITAAVLNAIGDLFAQLLVEKRENVDYKRLSIFTFLGAVLVGPVLHFWYLTLSRVVTTGGNAGAVGRLALDQLVFAPVFIATFFSAVLALSGQADTIPSKLKQDLKPTVLTNWKVWVPFQFINFRFVPQSLQVLMANIVSLGWNTYLSLASNKAVEK